jgi:hypothetical protein
VVGVAFGRVQNRPQDVRHGRRRGGKRVRRPPRPIASVVAYGEVGRDFAALFDFLLQATMDAAISQGWSRVLIRRRGARRSDGSEGGGSGALILLGTLSPVL